MKKAQPSFEFLPRATNYFWCWRDTWQTGLNPSWRAQSGTWDRQWAGRGSGLCGAESWWILWEESAARLRTVVSAGGWLLWSVTDTPNFGTLAWPIREWEQGMGGHSGAAHFSGGAATRRLCLGPAGQSPPLTSGRCPECTEPSYKEVILLTCCEAVAPSACPGEFGTLGSLDSGSLAYPHPLPLTAL